jgi:diacylglycerol O-acyltransferase
MSSSRGASRYQRLTSTDLLFLRLETEAWPCHFGGLAILEGTKLLDDAGELRFEEIRDRLDLRLARVSDLRQRVHVPKPLGGRPIWVDDVQFDIRRHVHQTTVPFPGGDAELVEKATGLYNRLLDRRRPLWELWLLTGLNDGRVGVLLKLHHAVSDGLGAMAIMGSLFDFEPDAPEPAAVRWVPEAAPGTWFLLLDSLSSKARNLGRAVAKLAHPSQAARGVRAFANMTRGYFGKRAAQGSSLNQPVQAGRLIRRLRLDLATMKQVAHTHGGKVNDIVLTLWTGGLRHLLESRGEPVAGVELITGMATTLRSETDSGTIDNRVGTMVLPLAVQEPVVQDRLDRIVRTTLQAKEMQRPAATMGYLAGLAATPIGKYFTAHQHASNTIVTNVIGPPVPVYLLGARVIEILPIIELVGNIGLTLAAFSYDGQMFMVVTADAEGFPDIEALMDGMEQDWHVLTAGHNDATDGAPLHATVVPFAETETPRPGSIDK